jgi:predicted cupin superfamily sugar epimerase
MSWAVVRLFVPIGGEAGAIGGKFAGCSAGRTRLNDHQQMQQAGLMMAFCKTSLQSLQSSNDFNWVGKNGTPGFTFSNFRLYYGFEPCIE